MQSTCKWVGILVIGVVLLGVQPFVGDGIRAEESQRDVLIDLFGHEFVSAEEFARAIGAGHIDEHILAALDQDLVFTPVTPCRIVDTRLPGPVSGAFAPNESREFFVYGTTEISTQGGNPAGCPSPRGEPSAVHMNAIAVPVAGQGNIRAYPADVSPPLATLVNYKTGVQNISNAATIKTFIQAGAREIEVLNSFGTAHLVIDVMGYFYPLPVP